MARTKPTNKKTKSVDDVMVDFRYQEAKRKNNPPAKIAAEGTVPPLPKIEYSYSPRLPPVLRFDQTGQADHLPELLEQARQRALTEEELKLVSAALRNSEPWLEWAGKREQASFSVDPVALHIHERVSAQAILRVAAREDIQRDMFADPQQLYHEAVQFYQHDIDWTNRLILGDSLAVMASLAKREDLAGKVQMIYMDPPYGIKYSSNFQPEIGRREVKENEQDLTREAEVVRAYRDTWRLGVHSYLSYLRDRFLVAKDLLADSGSIFVQISDENLHRVRNIMDEVFSSKNFCAIIAVRKTGGLVQDVVPRTTDYLLWYFRDREKATVHPLYLRKVSDMNSQYRQLELPTGERRQMLPSEREDWSQLPQGARVFQSTSTESANPRFDFAFKANIYSQRWKTNLEGLRRLAAAERIDVFGNTVRFVRYYDDFPLTRLTDVWDDTMGEREMAYVVQTNTRLVSRCILMTTKPGDLVMDPTCGSGTTAYVSEELGRRWITMDTSRVAIAIARQRLLTSKFDFYECKGKSIREGFHYKTVPHVTLKAIAQNTNLDPILARHDSILNDRLTACNATLSRVTHKLRQTLVAKLISKQKSEGRKSITEADRRRWELPNKWEHWQVPYDTDEAWPQELQEAVTQYRKAWRAKKDEVDACVKSNAEPEELVDQPRKMQGVVRVSGPFTVEAVQPPEMSVRDVNAIPDAGGGFAGEPEQLDTVFNVSAVESIDNTAVKNVEAYLDQMIRLLKTDGIRFPNNKQMRFTRLEPLIGTGSGLHAEGRWLPQGETDEAPEERGSVCVGFGPQYGPVTAKQVEQLIRDASRRGYDDLVVAGFSFDGPAQAVIEESQRQDLRIHMANVRPDVNPGMAGLLKEQPGSQLFTVFGQPRTTLSGPDGEGNYTVTMEGVDIYNPVDNSITPTGANKVAAWFIDSDYDGWTFCITQAFFPDRSAWDKLSRALNGPGGVIDQDRFTALSGTVSLPFPAREHKRVAVKVIDPRGNEVMKVHRL